MQEPGAAYTSRSEGAFPLVSLVWVQRKAIGGLLQPQYPGFLIAREGGRISLVTLQEKLFDADKHEIVARWPWYQLGQGLRLKVADKKYWFAWMPGSAASVSRAQIMEMISTLAGRKGLQFDQLAKAKEWRSYLKS